MRLLYERDTFTEESTSGILYREVDEGHGNFSYEELCYVIEDRCREVFGQPETFTKIPGKTAIPYGTYPVVIDWSPRFQKNMPHILNVPHYEGVRIHVANTAKDVEGCLGVGLSRSADFVGKSKDAFARLLPLLETALREGESVDLEITKSQP